MQSAMPRPDSFDQFMVYRNPQFGVVMEYPAAWQTQEDVTPATFPAGILSPLEPGSQFRENIVLIIQALLGSISLEDLLQFNLRQVQQAGCVSEPAQSLVFGGSPAYQYAFSGRLSPTLSLAGKGLCVLTTKGTRAYVLMYTARVERYSQYVGIFSRMIQTVRLV
jgi:hypothetical protein